MGREPDLNQVFYVLIALIAFVAIAAVGLPAIVGAFQNGANSFGAWQGLFVVLVLGVVAWVVWSKRHDR